MDVRSKDSGVVAGKITTKGQTTIPIAVRAALRVDAGDTILWEVQDDGSARVRRLEALDISFLRSTESTLGEWLSVEDEEAYRDL